MIYIVSKNHSFLGVDTKNTQIWVFPEPDKHDNIAGTKTHF